MTKKNWEQHFRAALIVIAHADSPAWMRRHSERSYGVDYAESLEYAYENIVDVAKDALKGYRRPKTTHELPIKADAVSPLIEGS